MTQPKKGHYRRKLPHYQQPWQWYSITFALAGAMPKGAMAKYSTALETARTRLEELSPRESDNPLSDKKESDFSKSDNLQLGKLKSGELDNLLSDTRELEFPNSGKSATLESCSPNLQVGNLQSRLALAKKEYQIALRKYRLAYDKILNNSALPGINLLKDENRKIIEEALLFWEGKRLANHAWCIMRNHVHWIITVFEKEAGAVRESDNPLSDSFSSSSATLESCSPERIEKPIYLQDILHSVKLFTARRINENENRTGQLWEHESFDTTIRNDRHFVNVYNYVIQNPRAVQF